MGARIAAHFANAGLPCILLDIVPTGVEADASGRGAEQDCSRWVWTAAKKSKPAAFFTAALADRIAIGNFDDDLARCARSGLDHRSRRGKSGDQEKPAGARRAISQAWRDCYDEYVRIASSADRGRLAEEFQQHWAGTHFFNPPRYLKLVELIPGAEDLARSDRDAARVLRSAVGQGSCRRERHAELSSRIGSAHFRFSMRCG